METGIFIPTKEQEAVSAMVATAAEMQAQGVSALWLPQSSGIDALTMLSVIAQHVPGLKVGSSVIPVYPRHPVMLAAQALTASVATGGNLTVGIGLSHKFSIEGTYGMSYEKPARYMEEYLRILMPLLEGNSVEFAGEVLSARATLDIHDAPRPDVLVAAMQPRMLRLAGEMTDGTVTWCTGPKVLGNQIHPLITAAATEAGRPAPRIVVALPTIVTNDEAWGRAQADEQLAGYGQIPVYRAVLDQEGADGPADISLVGDEDEIARQLDHLEEAGATEYIAILCGSDEDRRRTTAFLAVRGSN